MLKRHPQLRIRKDDQKRLRDEFDDQRIYFGFNVLTQQLEAWYNPNSGNPYIITNCESMGQAMKLMRNMMKYEKMRAKDLLAEIDAHNKGVIKYKEDDAMREMRLELQRIATGKQFFTMANPQARRHKAAV